MSSPKQQNGELPHTEGAESASSEQKHSRTVTDGHVENNESPAGEHPNVTVIVDGPDDGAAAASEPTPQPLTNHNQTESSEKPSDSQTNQPGDISNVSEYHWMFVFRFFVDSWGA